MASWLPWVRRRRRRLRQTPMPASWGPILEANVPLAAALSDDDRATLVGLMHLFLDDKTVEGCGGLEVTEAMRVTIAAHACLLLVGLDVDLPYPELDVIRLYPSTYRVPDTEWYGSVAVEGKSHRLGESSGRGYVVLAWDAVRRGGRDPDDGQNVVLHEFAHQLDHESGTTDGAPVLGDAGLYGPWARVLGRAFEELQQDAAAARRDVIDSYGAHSPPEFFAVVTEAFFETPEALQQQHPDLYEVLSRYFHQDPAAR